MSTVQDAAWHIVGTQQILVWMTGRDGKESKYEEIQTKKVFFFFQNLKWKLNLALNVVMTWKTKISSA